MKAEQRKWCKEMLGSRIYKDRDRKLEKKEISVSKYEHLLGNMYSAVKNNEISHEENRSNSPEPADRTSQRYSVCKISD